MIKMPKVPHYPTKAAQKCGAKIPRALLEIVKLLASVPIHKTHSGWKFRLLSWEFVGCFLFYLITFPINLMVLTEVYPFFQATAEDYVKYMSQQIYYELFITLMIPSMISPLTTWVDASSIAAYINRFTAFQDMFATTTGRHLQFKLRKKEVLAYGMLCVVTQNIMVQVLPPYLAFWKTSACAVNMVALATSVAYGVCRTDALSQAGEAIASCLKRELQANRCDVRKIVSYERLWLELSHLTTDSSSHYYRTVSVPLLLTIYMITISVYGLLASLREPFFAAFYVGCVILTTVPLYLLCNTAFITITKVRSFLETIDESPPIISLGGYAVLDRKFLHAAGATISTYLVVIFQFSMSLQKNEKEPCNSTHVLGPTVPTTVQ